MHLPVDDTLPELLAQLRTQGAAVLQAPTGSGKTTRVPRAVADAKLGPVVVLEPRRMAARASARWVARAWGCAVGEKVGYRVRFDHRPGSEVTYMTTGIFLRILQSDPFLEGIHTVIFDEFHERSVEIDLALALCRSVRAALRDDLRILAMSATLSAGPLAKFLAAPIITSEGRLFPVDIRYAPRPDTRPVAVRVAEAVAAAPTTGDVLVFLPGRREIREAAAQIPRPTVALHGSLEPAAQDAILKPAAAQRVILATNVAESSLTVPGVTTVIDTGLARIPRYDPAAGIDRLSVVPIAQDSADQRAGRAGRLGPGLAVRLWTPADHRDRPAHTSPQVHRADLTPALLTLFAFGEPDPLAFQWFERPADHAVQAGVRLLELLGVVRGGLTPLGERLAGLPLHPRLARFAWEAAERGQGSLGARWASWLSEGGRPVGELEDHDPPHSHAAKRLLRKLPQARMVDPDALHRAALAGWPDRVAVRRGEGAVMVGAGLLGVKHPLVVAIGLHPAKRGPRGEAWVQLQAEVEEGWLEISTCVEARFDGEKVVGVEVRRAGDLVLSERPGHRPPEAASMLFEAAKSAQERVFPKEPELENLLGRLRFIARVQPQPGLPDGSWESLWPALRAVCDGRYSFAQLKKAPWADAILRSLTWSARTALTKLAPERVDTPHRSFRLDYTKFGPPILAAQIKYLFGTKYTPQVCGQPVLLHLLAPNNRPQQITTDLAGFWANSYFEVRKDLRRRYPKHPWPDNPADCEPPRRRHR